ncbi:MAG TPA: clostripain-related cysteine peptidase [Candidatus Babeliales bacterium]|nr:clostripain-related cysteine peptidase [Candidatus Babeliales bacterium]
MKQTLNKILFILLSIVSTKCFSSCEFLAAEGELEGFTIEHENNPCEIRRSPNEKNPWTIIIYIAGTNDLEPFVWPNVRQLAHIGSNEFCNIVVQINEKNKNKPTQRYLIVKDKAILLNADDAQKGIKLDSGDEQTLIDFCSYCIDTFPSEKTALILWNHGSGYIDPGIAKTPNVEGEFFSFNPDNLMLEINRNIEFLETIMLKETRGICFDEIHKSYLTNAKLVKALGTVTRKMDRPFDLLGLDACLMSMVEFGVLVKPYCDIMVASQEVELGWGWSYHTAFARFANEAPSPEDFANEIVESYRAAYKDITPDYTLSACHLGELGQLDKNISELALLLMECIKNQKNNSVKNIIQLCRSRKQCTHFEEPSYIDIGHFYKNVLDQCNKMELEKDKHFLIQQVKDRLNEGIELINKSIFAMANGKNLAKATGLSIYFPHQTKFINTSYQRSTFAQNSEWINLLKTCMNR